MRYDMIIAGVGGQGILSIATVIGHAALALGWRLKQSEVHGMAQRGGAVETHLRIADGLIDSDLIPLGKARLILAMEPMEALRYLPWLAVDGRVVSNQATVENITGYPDREAVYAALRGLSGCLLFDALELARRHGGARAVNMAVLGAAAPCLPMPAGALESAITAQFQRKGAAVVNGNLAVFRAARAMAVADAHS